MIKKLLSSIMLSIIGLLLITSPALAIAPPDSPTPTIDSINAYEDCLETDDQLYVIEYTIYYAAPPTETVTEAFIFRLMERIYLMIV